MSRAMIILATALALGGTLPYGSSARAADAGLNANVRQRYDWRIVIDSPKTPRFSAVARERLHREILGAASALVDRTAVVRLIDLQRTREEEWEPLWSDFVEKGWAALDDPATREISGSKTSFLKFEVTPQGYQLQTRHLDGDTGLLSPMLRKQQTNSLDVAVRYAGLMCCADFGPVATVVSQDRKAGTAKVRFRAAQMDGFGKLVQPGDILTVSAVIERRGSAGDGNDQPTRVGQPRSFTLLRINDSVTADGTCNCQVLSSYANPMPMVRGVAGFRAMKIPTQAGRVTVQIVQPRNGQPITGNPLIRVRGSDSNFPLKADSRDNFDLRSGLYRSPRTMKNVACVIVGIGASHEVRFPVPVLDGDEPFPLPFETNEELAAIARFERDCEDLRYRAAELRTAQAALFEALGKLIARGENQAALERARQGLEMLQNRDKELLDSLNKLKEDQLADKPLPSALLAATDNQLQVIRDGIPALKERISDLGEAIDKSKDPVRFAKEFRAKELMTRIRQHLRDGEVESALALYEDLYRETMDETAKVQREKLAAEWKPKNDDHAKDRDFVYGEWRRASSVDEFAAGVDKVVQAANHFAELDDQHGLRGVLASLEPTYTRLKELADLLDPGSTTDKPILKQIKEVSDKLREMELSVRDYLKAAEQPGTD